MIQNFYSTLRGEKTVLKKKYSSNTKLNFKQYSTKANDHSVKSQGASNYYLTIFNNVNQYFKHIKDISVFFKILGVIIILTNLQNFNVVISVYTGKTLQIPYIAAFVILLTYLGLSLWVHSKYRLGESVNIAIKGLIIFLNVIIGTTTYILYSEYLSQDFNTVSLIHISAFLTL